LGIWRWLVLKNTFSDSAVVDGRLAMAVKSGGPPGAHGHGLDRVTILAPDLAETMSG